MLLLVTTSYYHYHTTTTFACYFCYSAKAKTELDVARHELAKVLLLLLLLYDYLQRQLLATLLLPRLRPNCGH